MNRINEAIQKKIDGAKVAKQEEKKNTVVSQTPTFADDVEYINACADKYDEVVDERQKDTDTIVPDEKQTKAHLDESLFEDADEEVEDEANDVYTYAYKTIVEDKFGDDRLAIASDHNNIGDYDIGIYCKSKDGEEEIKEFADNMLLFNNVIANHSDDASEYKYIHVVRIPDSVATMDADAYKVKYEIE